MVNAATSPASNAQILRIAIIGGGLAGAAAAGVLSRLPNVQVKAYERAPAIREAGAQIAVMVTALKALRRMLSPAAWDHLQSKLYRGEGTDGIHHRHWRTGEILTTSFSPDTPRHMQEGRISRVTLHRTLMTDVPDEAFQYGSEVVKIESKTLKNKRTEIVIHLKNGGTQTADFVVVADGLYSVRLFLVYNIESIH
jgi:salicylate hydroxylase